MAIFIGAAWGNTAYFYCKIFFCSELLLCLMLWSSQWAFPLYKLVWIYSISPRPQIYISLGCGLSELHHCGDFLSNFLFSLTNQKSQQEMGDREERQITGFWIIIFLLLCRVLIFVFSLFCFALFCFCSFSLQTNSLSLCRVVYPIRLSHLPRYCEDFLSFLSLE